jgi:anti-sigma factor RsiW
MMSRCDLEALEALALGELDEAGAQKVAAHVAQCASCKRELEWLRAERELIARRESEPVPPALWRGIEARLAPKRERRWPWVGGAVAVAAAAALLVVWQQKTNQHSVVQHTPDAGVIGKSHKKLDPKVAIDNAEKEYEQAISVMEKEIREKRPGVKLPPLPAKVEGSDPEARLAALDGYASYMHSLLDLEEKRR